MPRDKIRKNHQSLISLLHASSQKHSSHKNSSNKGKRAQTKNPIIVVNDQIGVPLGQELVPRVPHIPWNMAWMGECIFKHYPLQEFSIGRVVGRPTGLILQKILNLSVLSNDTELIPLPTIQYPIPVIRPRYSLLSNRKLKQAFNHEMPHWQDASQRCLSSTPKTWKAQNLVS